MDDNDMIYLKKHYPELIDNTCSCGMYIYDSVLKGRLRDLQLGICRPLHPTRVHELALHCRAVFRNHQFNELDYTLEFINYRRLCVNHNGYKCYMTIHKFINHKNLSTHLRDHFDARMRAFNPHLYTDE